MAKKIKTIVKLQVEGGKATPAPPVGTALGPHGINLQQFVMQFNEATKDKVGQVITCNTDQDVSSLKVGQVISANVKYVGDVPKPGITLYIYNIKAA